MGEIAREEVLVQMRQFEGVVFSVWRVARGLGFASLTILVFADFLDLGMYSGLVFQGNCCLVLRRKGIAFLRKRILKYYSIPLNPPLNASSSINMIRLFRKSSHFNFLNGNNGPLGT